MRSNGDQNTDGSNSIRSFYQKMREAGATGRMMLEGAAAAKWGVPASECQAKNHQVIHAGSNRKAGFWRAGAAGRWAKQPVPKKEDLKFKPASEFRYIGKNIPITDLDAIMAGTTVFGMDARRPGMVYASIERSPVIGGKLKSVDDSEARKVAGVSDIQTIPDFKGPAYGFQALGGVAVIANNTWAAMQGRKKLKVDWDPGPNGAYDSVAYKKVLQETVRKPGTVERNVGDVDGAFAQGAKTHEAEYYAPHLSHAPMEPPAAVAEYKDGKVEIWTATQNPQQVQDTVAAAVGVKKQDVICNVTLLGGGFGRKSKPDYVAEAAILSKQTGKPVKVVWSREDDIHFDFFHFCAAMYLKAALDEKGRPTAWLGRSAYPAMLQPLNQAEKRRAGSMGWSRCAVRHLRISERRTQAGGADGAWIGWLVIGGEHLRTRSGCIPSSTSWRRWRIGIAWSICSMFWGKTGLSRRGRRRCRTGRILFRSTRRARGG